VPVAFGSDAPVIDANPWPAIYSAVTGLTRDGRPLGDGGLQTRTVPVETALLMYTLAAAEAEGAAAHKGSITPGKLADLTLVDADPRAVKPDALKGIRPILTVLGGKVVWEA
jgi:predicted amidohydrolase YtcJ